MPKCGVCGWDFSERTLVKHGEICEDDIKAPSRKFLPELDDLIKMKEEGEGNE